DETGVYKNLLQEVSQRVGAALPQYTTLRSGLGHLPIFTCTVHLAGITFTGDPAKNKKQAEKNAAMAAWASLKQLVKQDPSSSSDAEHSDEQEQVTIARALLNYHLKEKMAMAESPNALSPFPKKFPIQHQRPSVTQPPSITTSKILPLIRPKSVGRISPIVVIQNDSHQPTQFPLPGNSGIRSQKFPAVDAVPYVPIRHFKTPYHGVAPPVTIRTAVPVFSAPQLPPPPNRASLVMASPTVQISPPVHIRETLPVFSAPLPKVEEPMVATISPTMKPSLPIEKIGKIEVSAVSQVCIKEATIFPIPPPKPLTCINEIGNKTANDLQESVIPGSAVSSLPKSSVGTFSLAAKSSLHSQDVENKTGDGLEEFAMVQGVKQLRI
ncbi:double-stranded RNA-binding protein 2-like, partial [Thalictrum thalictroides]